MPKKQPISLPSTPTTVLQPPSALLGHLRSTLEGASSGLPRSPTYSQDMLSPLVMDSPTMPNAKPFNNFTPLSTPKTLRRFSAVAPALPPPSPSENARHDADDTPAHKEKAVAFARRSMVVRNAFERWVQRANGPRGVPGSASPRRGVPRQAAAGTRGWADRYIGHGAGDKWDVCG